MRHHVQKRKLGRVRKTRKALLLGLARELILKERITTTEAKAKEVRPLVEKMITKARTGTLAARRLLERDLSGTSAKRLVDTVAPRYKERAGGYTRITKIGSRSRDAAPKAIIELV